MLRFLLQLFRPSGADGDAKAKGILQGNGRSDCEGRVAFLELVVASDLFVMDVDHMVAQFCWRVVP